MMRFVNRLLDWSKPQLIYPILCVPLLLYCAYCHYGILVQDRKLTPPLGLPNVVVHLDLKGAPPRLSYLASILPVLKNSGANGLLIEYEDMFPFESGLEMLRASNAYDKLSLELFLTEAAKLGFQIIPLLQTFGHMEYVLKHQQFRALREKSDTLGSICPTQNASKQLLRNMMEQIITFHGKIAPLTFIHIGCDEVYKMNVCEHCKDRHLDKMSLFAEHVKLMHKHVKELSPATEVLIWSDMLRGSKGIKLPVELVYWNYNWAMDNAFGEILTLKENANNIWAASAFKGADGLTSLVPDLEKRIENHHNWIQFLCKYSRLQNLTQTDFRGIILTGWSRYHHFAPVCDLLPASFPSLITNLILIQRYNTRPFHSGDVQKLISFYNSEIVEDVRQTLGCCMLDEDWHRPNIVNCSFEGEDLFNILDQVAHPKMNRRSNKPEQPRMKQRVAESMARYFDESVVEKYVKYDLTSASSQSDIESGLCVFLLLMVLFLV